ncbi:hypothetical protein GCM10009799_32810 [Nocardiopsis rhodophaea]|uniref:Transglycosylase SLT domain-containing protein n=1 Tax=Nocardiopsis rhodophaea TaxID=280238 RepID=A0ABN2TAX8_9ACTN
MSFGREMHLRYLRRTNGDDRGAQFVELATLTMLTASIIAAVMQIKPQDTFNDIVRDMVCRVEGPKCDGKTWTEQDRPKKPEKYDFGLGMGGRGGDNEKNKALGKKLADERGFTGRQWECLETLWNHESNWNHRAINPSSEAAGIPQLLPSAGHAIPPGYYDDPAVQIKWGLDYIEGRYQTPCQAWAHWQNPPNGSAWGNWY